VADFDAPEARNHHLQSRPIRGKVTTLMATAKLLLSLTAIALATVTGCGTDVRDLRYGEYPGDPPSDPPDDPVDPPAPCDVDPPPSGALVSLDSVTSGTFIGQTLHLAGRLDGTETYLVLGIQDGYAWVVDQRPDLLGPADLAPAGPGMHARFRSYGLSIDIDVIDTSTPEKPALKVTHSYGAEVPPAWQSVFSVVDDHLLFCGAMSPNPPPQLHSVPLDGTMPPFLIEGSGVYNVCSGLSHDAGTAKGRLWMAWGEKSDLFIYEASATSVQKIADYQYNPDGIHAYGAVLSASTDGERIVFDPANESEFFLYSVGSGEPIITHTVFGVQGPKRLLGVVDHIAYLATPEGVRAYDATKIGPSTDWYSLPFLDYHADIPFGPDLARLIAANDLYLAVVDNSDRFYLIPRGKSGPVEPLAVHVEPPASPPCESGK
jgi:hypothetical protein